MTPSTPGRDARILAWSRPIRPAPINATRMLASECQAFDQFRTVVRLTYEHSGRANRSQTPPATGREAVTRSSQSL